MYKSLFIIIFTTIFGIVAGRAQAVRAQPPLDAAKYIEISDNDHDFGNITFGVPVEYHVLLKNISNDTLALTNIVVSCGCTTPDYKPGLYPPGTAIDIKVAYSSDIEGVFNKQLSVVLQDKKDGQMVKIIRFHGTGIAGKNENNF